MAREGARVVVNDLGIGTDGSGATDTPAHAVVAEIIADGGEAVAHTEDISSAPGAEGLVAQAVNRFGRLDVLINNAGVIPDEWNRPLPDMTDDEWSFSLRVNLGGTFAPSRAAARYWRDQSEQGVPVDAAIINTSSESGVFANAGQSGYAAAKSAVATFAALWQKELGPYGVRVNAILPRARTRLGRQLDNPLIQPRDDAFDEWHPGNVSPFVAYLASAGCPLQGEVFLVAAGSVQRATPWLLDPSWKLEKSTRWTVAELAEAVPVIGVPSRDGWDTGAVP